MMCGKIFVPRGLVGFLSLAPRQDRLPRRHLSTTSIYPIAMTLPSEACWLDPGSSGRPCTVVDGWMEGWMDGWMDGMAGLPIRARSV